MCGRFALFSSTGSIADHFGLGDAPGIMPRYNIAPGQPVTVIRKTHEGTPSLAMAEWGLIPSWSVEAKPGYSTINARAETVAIKPAFRQAFRQRRCLIPADGYYEWKTEGKNKQPYFIFRRDSQPLAFAGLWERWEGGGLIKESCTIIVTDANAATRQIHDRMPVILSPDDYSLWLSPATEAASLQSMLKPCPEQWLACHAVASRVGNYRNDEEGLIRPIPVNESLW